MIEICVLAAVLVITGTVIGGLGVVSLGIRREELAFSLTIPTQDRVARGARRLNGVYTRLPGVIQEVSLHRQGFPLPGQEVKG